MGPAVAAGFLQRALNALNRGAQRLSRPRAGRGDRAGDAGGARRFPEDCAGAVGETVLVKAVEALQGERYLALAERRPANEAFLYGWLANRIG